MFSYANFTIVKLCHYVLRDNLAFRLAVFAPVTAAAAEQQDYDYPAAASTAAKSAKSA